LACTIRSRLKLAIYEGAKVIPIAISEFPGMDPPLKSNLNALLI